MQTAIRVGIADDHSITRYVLRRFIAEQEDMVLAGEAWSGNTALDLARKARMDVLLLDLMMPGRGGLDTLPMIKARSPDTSVLVLSGCPADHYAVNVMRLGASGFLNKQCEPEEIGTAIRVVATGRRYLQPEVAELLAGGMLLPVRYPHERLTDREFQLLLHFARGEGSTGIANEIALSPKTVSTYRSLILRKLGLKSNAEMTHYALVHGLID